MPDKRARRGDNYIFAAEVVRAAHPAVPSSEAQGPVSAALSESTDEGATAGAQSETSGTPGGARPPDTLENLRVLLLDDEQVDADLLTQTLRTIGIDRVVCAKTAEQVLQQLNENEGAVPDVLLLEVVLAGTHGIKLLTLIRSHEDPLIKALPVIVLTSRDSPHIFRRVTNFDIAAYLRKPVDANALRDALLRAMAGKVVERPLAFGRSWIDEVEDRQDLAESEPTSFWAWLFSIFGLGGKPVRTAPRVGRVDMKA